MIYNAKISGWRVFASPLDFFVMFELQFRMIEMTDTDRVKDALKRYLKQQDGEGALIVSGKKSYSAQDLIDEINQETEYGEKTVNNIISLTIDLLFRGKESIET